MGTLVISRHGESEWNLLGKWNGLDGRGAHGKGASRHGATRRATQRHQV